jgi:hypothetical protein
MQLAQLVLQDLSNIFFSTWYNTLQPAIFSLEKSPTLKVNLIFWGVALITAGLLIFYLLHLHDDEEEHGEPTGWRAWWIQALILGILGVLSGHAPAWAIGRQAAQTNGLWADRFALPAMLGASICIVALLKELLKNRVQLLVVVGILVGLACGANLRNSYEYVQSWNSQLEFYWQLTWRAPNLLKPTPILSNDEILDKMGVYPTSMAINLLYPPPTNLLGQPDQLSIIGYWFFSVDKLTMGTSNDLIKLRDGQKISGQTNHFNFDSSSLNGIVITADAQDGQCLWVINPADINNPVLPKSTSQIASLSNISHISDSSNPGYPSKSIFGNEPKHTWCYYFEKADLDRQYAKWSDIVALWGTAKQAGDAPQVGFEFNPFIIGMAHVGQWNTASQMTEQASKMTPKLNPYLCSLWQRLESETDASADRETAKQIVNSEFKCAKS